MSEQGDCELTTIISGDTYSCSFTAEVTGEVGETKTNTVTTTGEDDEGTPVSDSAEVKIVVVDLCDITKYTEPVENNDDWGTSRMRIC